jgi:hypothetical protein
MIEIVLLDSNPHPADPEEVTKLETPEEYAARLYVETLDQCRREHQNMRPLLLSKGAADWSLVENFIEAG